MELKVFTVYDSKAGFYLNPLYFQSKGEALRSWEEACNNPESQMCKHPSDFTFFHIGEFNNLTGEVAMYDVKESLGLALEFKRS